MNNTDTTTSTDGAAKDTNDNNNNNKNNETAAAAAPAESQTPAMLQEKLMTTLTDLSKLIENKNAEYIFCEYLFHQHGNLVDQCWSEPLAERKNASRAKVQYLQAIKFFGQQISSPKERQLEILEVLENLLENFRDIDNLAEQEEDTSSMADSSSLSSFTYDDEEGDELSDDATTDFP